MAFVGPAVSAPLTFGAISGMLFDRQIPSNIPRKSLNEIISGTWTLTAPVINGIVTTTGLTFPATAFSGNVDMAENNLLNVGIIESSQSTNNDFIRIVTAANPFIQFFTYDGGVGNVERLRINRGGSQGTMGVTSYEPIFLSGVTKIYGTGAIEHYSTAAGKEFRLYNQNYVALTFGIDMDTGNITMINRATFTSGSDNLAITLSPTAATSGAPLKQSSYMALIGAYWDGAASVERRMLIQNIMDATNSYYLAVRNDGGTTRLKIWDTGYLTLTAPPAFVANDKYLVIDASGNVHVSAVGPAS